jgi:hypothetical protein
MQNHVSKKNSRILDAEADKAEIADINKEIKLNYKSNINDYVESIADVLRVTRELEKKYGAKEGHLEDKDIVVKLSKEDNERYRIAHLRANHEATALFAKADIVLKKHGLEVPHRYVEPKKTAPGKMDGNDILWDIKNKSIAMAKALVALENPAKGESNSVPRKSETPTKGASR